MKKNTNTSTLTHIFLITLFATAMLFLGVFIGSRQVVSVEAQELLPQTEKYYTTIQVQSGDTLWDIADDYMSAEYENKTDFINEVKEMNHITGSMIRAGEILLIPYYSESPVYH